MDYKNLCCNKCMYFKDHGFLKRECTKLGWNLSYLEINIIAHVGCACHSSLEEEYE